MVMARDAKNVPQKISELQGTGIPFVIVCGEKVNHPNVVYRKASGKWDAINFGAKYIPSSAEIIIFNDVDNEIHNFELSLNCIMSKADLVHCQIKVSNGPQIMFYRLVNPIRQKFNMFASGDLMLIKRGVFEAISPIPPCIAEDSYMLFKALELGFRAYFCTEAYVTTKKTSNNNEEEAYKTRTTLGIYQALNYAKPPITIRIFYYLLPAFSPLLIVSGESGIAWAKGIRKAVKANVAKKQVTKF